jgi:excisionase family DNA binding protein
MLRVPQVSEILDISQALIYKLVSEGKLKGVKINRSVRIRPEDLEEYITDNLVHGSNPNSEITQFSNWRNGDSYE